MGVRDAPQWLPTAFARSALQVGATASREVLEAHARELLGRWSSPERHHHGLRHLVFVLRAVDEIAEETHHPDLVRLAAWYHGIVFSVDDAHAYSRSGGEDEQASAAFARADLRTIGVPPELADRVAILVERLRGHDRGGNDIDQLALGDAHLATLAVQPQDYRAYRLEVREEYAHIPERHYVQARIHIIEKLLGRRQLFVSPMGARWEGAARDNLTSELERLRAELDELGAHGPEGDVEEVEARHGAGAGAGTGAERVAPTGNRGEGRGVPGGRDVGGAAASAERHSAFAPAPVPAPNSAGTADEPPTRRAARSESAAAAGETAGGAGRLGPASAEPFRSSLETDPDEYVGSRRPARRVEPPPPAPEEEKPDPRTEREGHARAPSPVRARRDQPARAQEDDDPQSADRPVRELSADASRMERDPDFLGQRRSRRR